MINDSTTASSCFEMLEISPHATLLSSPSNDSLTLVAGPILLWPWRHSYSNIQSIRHFYSVIPSLWYACCSHTVKLTSKQGLALGFDRYLINLGCCFGLSNLPLSTRCREGEYPRQLIALRDTMMIYPRGPVSFSLMNL